MPPATASGLNINYKTFGDDGQWVALFTGGRCSYQEIIPARATADGLDAPALKKGRKS